jgi:hypothetical protein
MSLTLLFNGGSGGTDGTATVSGSDVAAASGSVAAFGDALAAASGLDLAVASASVPVLVSIAASGTDAATGTASVGGIVAATASGSDATAATGVANPVVSTSAVGVDASSATGGAAATGDGGAAVAGSDAATATGTVGARVSAVVAGTDATGGTGAVTASGTSGATTFCYDAGSKALVDGTLDWVLGNVGVMLVNSGYTPAKSEPDLTTAAAHELSTYGGVRRTLSSKTLTNDTANDRTTFDAADPAPWPMTAGDTLVAAVLYVPGADDAHSIPLFYVALPAFPTVAATVGLVFDSSGIIHLNN